VFHAAEIRPRVERAVALRAHLVRAIAPFLDDQRLKRGERQVIGWEAGIRTPITWSREPFTESRLLSSVRFHAVFLAITSAGSLPFRCVLVQRVSLCLTPPMCSPVLWLCGAIRH
jgi:hypothetical protein